MNTIRKLMSRGIIQENGCVIWPGWTVHGYGACSFRNRQQLVHRVLYAHFVGPISPGYQLHHTCENRRCINFAHLEPLLPADHVPLSPNGYRTRTHCPNGHPLSGDNLRVRREGGRRCIACAKQRDAERYQRVKQGVYAPRDRDLCRNGHPLSGENLLVERNGARRCRICRRASNQKCDQQNRATPLTGERTIEAVLQRTFSDGDCLIWTGCAVGDEKNGYYGSVGWKGKVVKTHRLVYEQKIGAIPKGWEVHHRCRKTLCINPEHLECLDPKVHRAQHEQ